MNWPQSRKKHRKPLVKFKRILAEATAPILSTGFKTCGEIELDLSDILDKLPMTIDQDNIKISARAEGKFLAITVYCEETLDPSELVSGEFEEVLSQFEDDIG